MQAEHFIGSRLYFYIFFSYSYTVNGSIQTNLKIFAVRHLTNHKMTTMNQKGKKWFLMWANFFLSLACIHVRIMYVNCALFFASVLLNEGKCYFDYNSKNVKKYMNF